MYIRNISIKKVVLICISVILAAALFILFYRWESMPKLYSYEKIVLHSKKKLNKIDIVWQQIYMVDNKGDKAKITSAIPDDNSDIMIIYPPEKGYKPGKVYTLNIKSEENFRTDDNKPAESRKYRILKDKEVNFNDENLERAVKNQIGKQSGKLYLGEICTLKTLNASYYNISDITGIKKLSSLTNLYLSGNKIEDISELKHLKNLKNLSLDCNNISDISSLEKLTMLQSLYLSNNNVNNYDPIRSYYKNLKARDFKISK